MKINIFKTNEESSQAVANAIAKLIKTKPNAVLGFATGGSPVLTYKNLVEMYKQNEISFQGITTFNLDEYIGLEPTHKKSYRYYMNEMLFDHVDINKNNTFIPSGIQDPTQVSNQYEELLDKYEIDIQILGIGTNGHIGFNEPGSEFNSVTRKVSLAQETIEVNTRFFDSINDVPKTAISMGIGSIMKAKKIILIASGLSKAQAIKDTVKGLMTTDVPSSALQNHPDVELYLDEEAASLIK